jgi:hypothetical protein
VKFPLEALHFSPREADRRDLKSLSRLTFALTLRVFLFIMGIMNKRSQEHALLALVYGATIGDVAAATYEVLYLKHPHFTVLALPFFAVASLGCYFMNHYWGSDEK